MPDLVGTWTFHPIAIVARRDCFGGAGGSGPAVSSLPVDLLVVAVAGSIAVEATRVGVRFA